MSIVITIGTGSVGAFGVGTFIHLQSFGLENFVPKEILIRRAAHAKDIMIMSTLKLCDSFLKHKVFVFKVGPKCGQILNPFFNATLPPSVAMGNENVVIGFAVVVGTENALKGISQKDYMRHVGIVPFFCLASRSSPFGFGATYFRRVAFKCVYGAADRGAHYFGYNRHCYIALGRYYAPSEPMLAFLNHIPCKRVSGEVGPGSPPVLLVY